MGTFSFVGMTRLKDPVTEPNTLGKVQSLNRLWFQTKSDNVHLFTLYKDSIDLSFYKSIKKGVIIVIFMK